MATRTKSSTAARKGQGTRAKPAAKRKPTKSKAARSSARASALHADNVKLNPTKHKVMVRYAKDTPWETGLRGHMAYRDTGIGAATNGEFGAFVMKPRHPGVPIAHPHKHRHSTSFQMVYILEGKARFWLDGLGEITVTKGDCFYQPDGLLHQAIEISDDLELLEITMPLEFETVTP